MKLKKYAHFLFVFYLPIYMYCFTWLEARNDVPFQNIWCVVDDWIPFCEYFIIPYMLWFLYVAVVVVYLAFQFDHLEDFFKCALTLLTGMSICLLIYYVFPNEQNLRPEHFAHNNIFTDLVKTIYKTDTKTNVLPSIHVFNAVAIHVGISTCHRFKNVKGLKIGSLILCILICASTVCLKQHSFLDLVAGLALYGILYFVFYRLIKKWRNPDDSSVNS